MKRVFATMMAFVMLFGTTAYAKEDKDIDEFKVKANGETIEFEVEKQVHEIDCMHRADPEIKMIFEEGFDGDEEKLYFQIKWSTPTEEEPDIDNYYIPPRIFSVALKEKYMEETEVEFQLKFDKREYKEETAYSLWLVGGDEYDDNFLYGKKDLLLTDEFVVFKAPEVPVVQTPTEVLLTVGKETIQYKGEQKYILEPVIFNDTGRLMIAAKDVGMIMEGAQTAGFNILWNKDTRTVTLQMGERTISMSEGDHKWMYQGVEMHTDTVPEIRNGVMYLPLRELAKLFDFGDVTWNGSTQTVRLYREMY